MLDADAQRIVRAARRIGARGISSNDAFAAGPGANLAEAELGASYWLGSGIAEPLREIAAA